MPAPCGKLKQAVLSGLKGRRAQEVLDLISETNPDAVRLDDFDECLAGIAERHGMSPVLAYDREKIIEHLMRDGLTREEAEEHFGFNILDAWVGEGTPVFITLV